MPTFQLQLELNDIKKGNQIINGRFLSEEYRIIEHTIQNHNENYRRPRYTMVHYPDNVGYMGLNFLTAEVFLRKAIELGFHK